MNERRMQFRVGVMVLATLIISVILMVLFGKMPSLVHGSYTIHIRFNEAPGVSRDTPVRKSGIRIGRVTDVRFADDDTTVLITAEIDATRKIYHNEVCRASNSIVLGDASLEFARSPDPNAPRTPIQDGETLNGVLSQDPNRAIANLQQGLSDTLCSVDATSKEMNSLLRRADRLLANNEERINQVIGQADRTLQVIEKTLNNANDVLGDTRTREQLKQAVAQMPEVLKDTRETMDRMGQSLGSLSENLRNLEGLTKPLGERGETLVQRLDVSTLKLDRLMDEMLRFTQDLNNPQGSVGQLIHDPTVYQHLARAAKNIDEVSRALKPIVDDARVFSDKIARHPESLGVRGALQRNPGIK